MSFRLQAVRLTMLVGAAAALAATSTAAIAAPGASGRAVPRLTNLRPLYDVGVHSSLSAAGSNAAATLATSVPMFSSTIVDGGTTFHYSMVGKSPFVKQSAPSTTVKTVIVPVIIKLSNGDTFDPTKGDSCDATSSLSRTSSSPIFKAHAYTWGGAAVGTTQYVDAFQRASFWKYTKPGAINPGYHVMLGATTVGAITVNVPAAQGAEGTATCGKLGAMEINWWDNYVKGTLFPQLAAKGVGSTTFPIFLLDNVVEYISTTSNCCVLGYHSAFNNPSSGNHVQTYATAMYDNTGDFTGSKDVSALSHEVGEWMDDPMVNNATKPWGHIGQVSGCQANLEVGDPLSGTVLPVTMNGHTYHVQEMAFFSWFYHQRPSIGVNGWYSNNGKFRTPAAACS